ncbi:MAG TPA: hypothetical protein VEB86_15745 [Chryseosolibacter sp.]|nr:hypothetical protein [Chryseosolibacter sp.]
MAKVAAKTSAPKKKPAAKPSPAQNNIEKVCEAALQKLRELGIQQQLQNDIEWCLGSYRADGNPVGLYSMAERALAVFQEEKARKTKGITAKNISDIEKALQVKA